MGGGSSPPSSQTVTQVSEPPEYVEGPATSFLARANSLSQQPFRPYTGQRVAGLTDQHLAGVGDLTNQVDTSAARNVGLATLRGDYFDANPYLDRAFNRAAGAVQSQMLNSALGSAGGMTNSGIQETFRNNLNNLAESIYGGNYQQERDRQLGVMQTLPGIAEQSARMRLAGGDVLRDYQQALLNEQLRRYEEAQRHPYEQLDVLGRAIGMSMGGGFGTTTSTQPSFFQPNSTASMLGGGLAGLGALQGLGLFGGGK